MIVMSKLLIADVPLVVLPKLAEKIGLNEAIFLQQLHYRLEHAKYEIDGHRWVYNTVNDWSKQFPFWSQRTLARTISSLEKRKLVLTGNYNRKGFDRTKWYTIDYDLLDQLELEDKEPTEDVEELESENPDAASYPKEQSEPEFVSGRSNRTDCPNEENQGVMEGLLSGISIMPNCPNGEIREPEDSSPSASCQSGRSNLPNWHDGSRQDDEMESANLSVPIPTDNNNRVPQRTTTTLRTSQLPMEKVPASAGWGMERLLLLAQQYGISEATIRKYIRSYGEELVSKECALLKKSMEKKIIKNPAGWLHSALENQYEDTLALYEQEQQAKKAASAAKVKAIEEYYAQQEAAKETEEIDPTSPFYKYLLGHKGGEQDKS